MAASISHFSFSESITAFSKLRQGMPLLAQSAAGKPRMSGALRGLLLLYFQKSRLKNDMGVYSQVHR